MGQSPLCAKGKSMVIVVWSAVVALVAGQFGVSGCAFDVTDVRYSPTQLAHQPADNRSFTLAKDVELTQTPCGYSRTLRQGTRWERVGTVPQGEVFKSPDQVLTVECSNVFEAYLIVSQDRLIGFYLPVEKGFVAVPDPIPFLGTR